jgi:hypothetical protein
MDKTLQQVGELFGLEVLLSESRTTSYFAQMAKLSKVLLAMDAYLVSYLPIKVKPVHYLGDYNNDDVLYVDVSVGVDGNTGHVIKNYLRQGKELILASLASVSDRPCFDRLVQELTTLIDKAEKDISTNLSLDGIPARTISEIDLIRLLKNIWSFFCGLNSSAQICVVGLASKPKVFFAAEPPFAVWTESDVDDGTFTAWFRLRTVHFEGRKDWKAYLVIDGKDAALVNIKVVTPEFWEKLKSSQDNAPNGLLAGDILRTKCKVEEDQLAGISTYLISRVENIYRADECIQEEMFQEG